MKKRLLSMFTALTLCVAFVPAPALAEEETASGGGLIGGLEEGGAGELNNSYNKGEDSGSGLIGAGEGASENGATEISAAEDLAGAVGKGGSVKLAADIDISATLVVAGDATLDLNGYVLRMANNVGSVFKVEGGGSLTIEDSNTGNRSHRFNATNDLWVLDENGTEIVKGGVITGGTGTTIGSSTYGGGVLVESGGTLVVTGGSIIGCTASFGGGAYVAPIGKFDMGSGAEIRSCVARNGGGVYIARNSTAGNGVLMLHGGKISSCEAEGSSGSGRGGGVYNEGTFTMASGSIQGCTASAQSSEGVWSSGTLTQSGGVIEGNVTGSGTISLTVEVYTSEEFLAALKNGNVATIRLKGDIPVNEGETLTLDRAITLVGCISGGVKVEIQRSLNIVEGGALTLANEEGSRNKTCGLRLRGPLNIAKGGALTLEGKAIFDSFSSVTVEGGMTVGANCEASFEGENASLCVKKDGIVKTLAAEEGSEPGLLSLSADIALVVDGKLVNEGALSVSDSASLEVAAGVGGNLNLHNAMITRDCALDMKGSLLTIEGSLKFDDSANLIVRNGSVKAVVDNGTIFGGRYYCPVTVGGNDREVSGGNFYDTVTFTGQDGGHPTPVFGGTFYGGMEGKYSIEGHPKVTFMSDDAQYAIQVTSGKATVPDVPSKDGYTFAGWYTETGEKFDFETTSVTGDITLTAKWAINSSPRYAIVVPDEPSHGVITVNAKYAYRGATVNVAVMPDSGYVLETLAVTDARGNELTLTDKGDGTFIFVMPGGKVEVRVSFMEDNSLLNLFYDVPNDAYFYEAVKWAVSSSIAQGYGNGMFGPDDPCTRGQVITFLWRAAGCPEPSAPSSFFDVSQDAYYAKAVAWAVEAGIAHGYGSDTFGPDDACTRAQAVTFLWRATGSPESAASSGFADVAGGAYYADAVAWAAENGIAHGYDNGSFGPDDGCTRGQAVTFLWRANS